MGAWQTVLCAPIVDNGRLPKNTAGHGLTSTAWSRNIEEEEPQREGKAKITTESHGAGRSDDL